MKKEYIGLVTGCMGIYNVESQISIPPKNPKHSIWIPDEWPRNRRVRITVELIEDENSPNQR